MTCPGCGAPDDAGCYAGCSYIPSNYQLAEDHILKLADGLTPKELIHMAVLLLTKASARMTTKKDKRTKTMTEVLAADVQKLEGELRG